MNSRGKKLIETIAKANLTIFNGNTLGDVSGRHTCYLYNGSSVVDYMISTDSIKHRTANFIVGDLDNFSDHSPLYLKLDCSLPTKNLLKVQNFENVPKRFLWNANCDPERFKSAQQNKDIRGAIEKICSLKCQNSDDVYECNEMLVKLYQKLARNSLASCTQAKKVHARKGNHHEPWFTAELLREKRRVNRHNHWLSKHPEDSQLRAKLFQLKKYYKKKGGVYPKG